MYSDTLFQHMPLIFLLFLLQYGIQNLSSGNPTFWPWTHYNLARKKIWQLVSSLSVTYSPAIAVTTHFDEFFSNWPHHLILLAQSGCCLSRRTPHSQLVPVLPSFFCTQKYVLPIYVKIESSIFFKLMIFSNRWIS